jgi:hypothetical protein
MMTGGGARNADERQNNLPMLFLLPRIKIKVAKMD